MNWKKFNPLWWFANEDDPVADKGFKPVWPIWLGKVSKKLVGPWPEGLRQWWWLYARNPLHNFTFYIIGIYDKIKEGSAVQKGLHPGIVFAPGGGWNLTYFRYSPNFIIQIILAVIGFTLVQKYGYIKGGIEFLVLTIIVFHLPMVSYRNKYVMFYLGWRDRGNFGVKLVPDQLRLKKK